MLHGQASLRPTSQSASQPPLPEGEALACRSGSRGTREVFRIGNSSALLSRSTDANLCSKARHFMPNQTFSGQLKVSRSANGASHPGCGSQRLLRSRLHPAGRGPNSDSLFPPPAAVVAVAPFGGAGAERLRGLSYYTYETSSASTCSKSSLSSLETPSSCMVTP